MSKSLLRKLKAVKLSEKVDREKNAMVSTDFVIFRKAVRREGKKNKCLQGVTAVFRNPVF